LKVNGTCKSIGSYKTMAVDKHFRNVYNLFSDTFSQYVTEDQFIDNIFGTDGGDWKYSTIKNRVLQSEDTNKIVSTLLCNAAHTYFQIHNFITNLDKVMTDEPHVPSASSKSWNKIMHINQLLTVRSESDMMSWLDFNRTKVKSKRINRDSDMSTIEGFFA